MSFESYAQHLTEKYRVAVALAVLKEKPENVTIQNYLKDLKDKLNVDINEDTQLTVCSDDFIVDEDIVNDNDTNDSMKMQSDTNTSEYVYNHTLRNDVLRNNVVANLVYNESINNQSTTHMDNDLELNHNSVSTLENVINDDMINNCSKITEVISHTQESISILKDVVIEVNDYSYIKTKGNSENTENIKSTKNLETQKLVTQEIIEIQDIDATYCNTQIYENAQNDYSNIKATDCSVDEILNKSADAKTLTQKQNTQNYTHVSQSQNNSNIIIIKSNLFKPTVRHERISRNDNLEPYNALDNNNISVTNLNNTEPEREQERNEIHNYDYSSHTAANNQLYHNKSEINQKNKAPYNEDHNVTQNNIKNIENNEMQLGSSDNVNMDTLNLQICKPCAITENDVGNNDNNDVTEDLTESYYDDANEETVREELISFKVIEELNRVKCYLYKTIDRRISSDGSIDSGYRSDSQSRGSYKNSSQSSGSSLNQSGRCLFDYVITAPIVRNNRDITNEIAQVLASLIDKLHEEEKYLMFLDEVLSRVDGLLQDIIATKTNDNALLEKDEDIHRLFLLNTSPHIQRYTIQKIITNLENLQPRLCGTDELYEISNTDETENLCYIFHILEVLLERYVCSKEPVTPKSSQNELKKSTISDLWRKKFYPACRTNAEHKQEVISPKECILKKCAEVLNKFIVSCMDGYSLVSYVALQCFNVLQT